MCVQKIKFDREYSTTYVKEKQFLDICGVRYAFVKTVNGATTFKYKKTPYLFECLSKFYKQISEKNMEENK